MKRIVRLSAILVTVMAGALPARGDGAAAEPAAEQVRLPDGPFKQAMLRDQVYPGEPQSDQDHQFKGQRSGVASMTDHRCRYASDGGWFSYVLKVAPDRPMALCCTYWGDDAGRRQFDILVGDTPIATEKLMKQHPGEFFDVTYSIAPNLTQGKTEVVVRFQAAPGNTAGGVFGIRMLRAEPAAAKPIAAPAKPAARPNFLVVLIDDMGYADLSCYGNTEIKTENIDRLAAEGMRFRQFYVGSPICSPSRTALTTGQFPARWRINSYLASRKENNRRGIDQWLDPRAPTLARQLQRAGYATGHFGKWHMGGQRDVGEAPLISEYGFDASLTQFEGLGDRILPLLNAHDGKPLRKDALGSDNLGRGKVEWLDRSYLTQAFTERAIAFIQEAEKRGQPFYVNLWPTDVHSPYYPPKEMRGDGSKRQLYLGVLKTMDRQLGPVFDYLRRSPALRDNTLVLLMSDNGPEPGGGSAGSFRGEKGNLYEGGIREPLIVWGPGFIAADRAGSVNEKTVVGSVDVAPSLLHMARVNGPEGVRFDGIDLSDSLVGKAEQARSRPLMWKRPPDRPGPAHEPWPDLAVRDGDWKLLVHADGSRPQLYDLRTDPGETTNVADTRPEVVRHLSKLVLDWNATLP